MSSNFFICIMCSDIHGLLGEHLEQDTLPKSHQLRTTEHVTNTYQTLLEDFSHTSRHQLGIHASAQVTNSTRPSAILLHWMLVGVRLDETCLLTRHSIWRHKAVGLTQVERSQIHTHLPRRWSCLCSTDGQSMGPEIAQLLTATSLHSKKIIH